MSVKPRQHARELLLKEYRGVLSTHSRDMPGYPFGSAVPYCLEARGWPLLLLSRIAQHTRNLGHDSACSLLVGERGARDVQAAGRLTLLAEAQPLGGLAQVEAAAARYYRYFPEARGYHSRLDFDFWCLRPVRWRYIGGFGAARWLGEDEVARANPFAEGAGEEALEAGMVAHMNSDHAAAIAHYVKLAGLPAHEPAELVGIDPEGFHLRIGQGLYWLPFPTSCNSAGEVREALVRLARADQWPALDQSSA